jgi:hypothetical protein
MSSSVTLSSRSSIAGYHRSRSVGGGVSSRGFLVRHPKMTAMKSHREMKSSTASKLTMKQREVVIFSRRSLATVARASTPPGVTRCAAHTPGGGSLWWGGSTQWCSRANCQQGRRLCVKRCAKIMDGEDGDDAKEVRSGEEEEEEEEEGHSMQIPDTTRSSGDSGSSGGDGRHAMQKPSRGSSSSSSSSSSGGSGGGSRGAGRPPKQKEQQRPPARFDARMFGLCQLAAGAAAAAAAFFLLPARTAATAAATAPPASSGGSVVGLCTLNQVYP